MIKLKLTQNAATLAAVKELPGLEGLTLDPKFGIVAISPKEGLYVVRTDRVDNVERRRALSPEIIEVYGDVRISGT